MGCAHSSEAPVAAQTGGPVIKASPLPEVAKAAAVKLDPARSLTESSSANGSPPGTSGELLGTNKVVEPSAMSTYVPDGKTVKERRAAAGTEAVRDQIRKLAVGTGGAAEVLEVSDSEDEDGGTASGDRGWAKPTDTTTAICDALRKNFVFRGIGDELLSEIVDRMYGVSFKAGSTVLQQGAYPKPDDCMYFLEVGEADVEISGAVERSNSKTGEVASVVGHTVHIAQKPGWVFGDVALLFNSARTASVLAKSNITVWALDRTTFLRFVMRHAQGARALRFLRKLPLLKGLSDNDLIRAAARMPQRVYEDGQPLIQYGERGDELFLIRYGKVQVRRPDGRGGNIDVCVLGRGQFVGERAVVNNKLRSADCVANGRVQVVVMKKRDFMELDNPLLAWMMDYDAVSSCVRFVDNLKGLTQEQQEQLMDLFDVREQVSEGTVVVKQGDVVDSLCVIKLGEIKLIADGAPISDSEFVREAGGFSFFGEKSLTAPFRSPYTVLAQSESVHMIRLKKEALDAFLGKGVGLSRDEMAAALRKIPALAGATEHELKAVLQRADERSYVAGDIISPRPASAAGSSPSTLSTRLFLVTSGEVALVAPNLALPGQVDPHTLVEGQRMGPGDVVTEADGFLQPLCAHPLSKTAGSPPPHLVAGALGATVLRLSADDVGRVLEDARASEKAMVRFQDLEQHRIIGTGQFGLVRLVRDRVTKQVYALKVMHKAPVVEGKQIEHVLSERRILEMASSPFCVQLKGAYQDPRSLYLLQEWVPGGELFHLLDLEGSFDEKAAMFYAANVLKALEFLHERGIVYRDLKPENLLIDASGYLKMADFGFAKYLGPDKTHTICGTPDYQAPEVIMRRGTNKAADYWALGVLIFEMLVGDPPFKSLTGDPWDTFRQALSGRFYIPNFISDGAADIIFKLLQVNPEKRLGSGPTGADEIKAHRFFAGMDWEALDRRTLQAPTRPKIRDPLDTSNFDNFDTCDVDAPAVPKEVAAKQPGWDDWAWI
ncbi:hypothetical protein FOA52_003920 [Chlamydomonas sp. UWO 241]|nr:hypothetical protein FOA52_003920 [Chlamydomonas sp. UWO 241]